MLTDTHDKFVFIFNLGKNVDAFGSRTQLCERGCKLDIAAAGWEVGRILWACNAEQMEEDMEIGLGEIEACSK